jgi:serine/threonine protein kinase
MAFPDRYQISRELGRGGMGVVYLAFDSLLKRQVAIKSVLRPQGEEPQSWLDAVQRLIREAQAAGSLRHPNIVAIYDILPDRDSPSIIMEFVNGKTLVEVVSPGTPMESQLMIQVLRQCAGALDHGHSRGIVHRDIKPTNIMLDDDGLVRITDFGIAKQLNSTTDLTHGFALGTLEYMSPEQLEGRPVDGASDQYSLAVMAYKLLTGRKIFDAQTIGAWCAMVLAHDPLPASTWIQGLPREVDPILSRAMSKISSARYRSCAEFASEFEEALLRPSTYGTSHTIPGNSTEQAPSADTGRPEIQSPINLAPRRRPSKALLFFLVTIVAVVGLGVAVKFVSERRPLPPYKAGESAQTATVGLRALEAQRPPVIDEFSSSRSALRSGEATELHWNVHDATDVSIRGIGNALPMQGSRTINPDSSKTYLLEASGPGGTVKRPLTVNVTRSTEVKLPVIEAFTASRSSIQSGQSTLLQWNVTGAGETSIAGVGKVLPGQTSRLVCPTVSKAYVLTASGPGGTVRSSVNVSVVVPPGENVKLNEFRADPTTISPGESSILRWEVENASLVWIDPDIGQVDACGVLRVQPLTTTKYQLSYQNDRGTMRSKPVIITVH